jgi:alkanesulfonate monooxygenase SsuD/methylene tetrahydromethanopterin reductase-like flavin-dependent oxidoreductase (luciferase family)
MRIGLQLPQGYFSEFDGWDSARAWRRILDVAKLGERLGFESLWTGEHVLSKWPAPGSIAFDCFVLSSAVAAVVPGPEIGFDIVNSTFRNPALTAKMAATLDAVADGRVVLGLGAGFREIEATTYGFDFPNLKERMAALSEHYENHHADAHPGRGTDHLRGPVRTRPRARQRATRRSKATGEDHGRRPRSQRDVPARGEVRGHPESLGAARRSARVHPHRPTALRGDRA